MKKLSFICSLLLILGLLATPAFSITAIKFDFDNDPNTWETEAWLTEPGETLNVDVWLTGYTSGPNVLFIDHFLYYDETKLSPGDCIIEPPWGGYSFCGCMEGECWTEVVNYSGGVPPADKIKVIRWVFNAIGGDSQIQSAVDDTITDVDWSSYDIDEASLATIHGPCGVSITPYSSNINSGETIEFSASPDGEACTNPSDYTWEVISECGSVIDPDTGLYTAGCLVGSTSSEDTIKANDTANNGIGYATVTLNGCRITWISGGTIVLSSGESKSLSASQTNCADPFLIWYIDPPSIIGSTIVINPDGTALYTAGYNTGTENVIDNIRVIDVNSCCVGESIECAGKTKQVTVVPCIVDLDPKDKTRAAGGTIQFNATSDCCGEPTYNWAISAYAGIGSSISATGSYRAGRNFANCNPVTETIEVTEVGSGKTATTDVTVKACKVTIDSIPPPIPENVELGETIQFSATTECLENPPSYSWSLSSGGSTSGGTIDSNGLYTAGPLDGIDIVKVTDTANYKAAHTATVTVGTPASTTTTTAGPSTTTTAGPITTTTVGPITTTTVGPITTTTVGPITTTTVGPTTTTTAASTTTVISTTTTTTPTKSIEVSPPEVARSRWIPLFRLMNIKGTGTNFAIFKTPVEYDSKSVLKLPALILSPETIWQVILIMPSLLTGIGFDGESETVTVTVDGVSDTFEIKMLPAPFDEKKNLK